MFFNIIMSIYIQTRCDFAGGLPEYQSNMFNSTLSLYLDMARLAVEAQHVIGMRLMLISSGGAAGKREAQRMVSEKLEIAGTIAFENAVALASGRSFESIGKHTVDEYSRVVTNNRSRLSR